MLAGLYFLFTIIFDCKLLCYVFCLFLVLAVILICLFPLWPENIREYSWYLSVAGAVCVGIILVLAVCKSSFFAKFLRNVMLNMYC